MTTRVISTKVLVEAEPEHIERVMQYVVRSLKRATAYLDNGSVAIVVYDQDGNELGRDYTGPQTAELRALVQVQFDGAEEERSA